MKNLTILLLVGVLAGCGGYPDDIDIGQGLDENDRNLFAKAKVDLQRGNYTQARLLLQTLIQTYPDSEFVPEAKYAIAESWYQMGTRADLAQADYEFSDYIIFYPTTELADDAQMMRAMTHIRQMQKADRDPTQALLAERELQALIDGYPDSNLLDESKEKLRGVQDVIAEHYIKIGNHYFASGIGGAAATRYLQVLREYPDYDGNPEALFRLGELFYQADNTGEAIVYYSRLVREHPFSEFDSPARERLTELDQPIPEPSEAVLAVREMTPVEEEYRSLGARMFGIFSGRPDISTETTAASVLVDDPESVEPGQGEFSVDGVVIDASGPPSAQ